MYWRSILLDFVQFSCGNLPLLKLSSWDTAGRLVVLSYIPDPLAIFSEFFLFLHMCPFLYKSYL